LRSGRIFTPSSTLNRTAAGKPLSTAGLQPDLAAIERFEGKDNHSRSQQRALDGIRNNAFEDHPLDVVHERAEEIGQRRPAGGIGRYIWQERISPVFLTSPA